MKPQSGGNEGYKRGQRENVQTVGGMWKQLGVQRGEVLCYRHVIESPAAQSSVVVGELLRSGGSSPYFLDRCDLQER